MAAASIAVAYLPRLSSDGNDCMLSVTSFSFCAAHHLCLGLDSHQGVQELDVDILTAYLL